MIDSLLLADLSAAASDAAARAEKAYAARRASEGAERARRHREWQLAQTHVARIRADLYRARSAREEGSGRRPPPR